PVPSRTPTMTGWRVPKPDPDPSELTSNSNGEGWYVAVPWMPHAPAAAHSRSAAPSQTRESVPCRRISSVTSLAAAGDVSNPGAANAAITPARNHLLTLVELNG